MASGRRVNILGKPMVINLNNKGGVRRAHGSTAYNGCVASKLAGQSYKGRAEQRAAFRAAASSCKGKKG